MKSNGRTKRELLSAGIIQRDFCHRTIFASKASCSCRYYNFANMLLDLHCEPAIHAKLIKVAVPESLLYAPC